MISVLLASASVGFTQEVIECGEDDESLLEISFDFSGHWYIEPLKKGLKKYGLAYQLVPPHVMFIDAMQPDVLSEHSRTIS